ncbi:STAS domain-containing protein [Streptomyces tagetis]|uniref:STAS domain-containing protein n=1 Tax=Streptomyces tagetis TaxID=2820809 RepID=UPI0027DC0646|nr:STAS domain-containing protein [Streptomyces sp. RG38]
MADHFERAALPERLLITRSTTGGGVCLVTLAGEVDLDGCRQLRDVLLSSVGSAPGTVVDLGEVAFLDSSGINVLISAHRAATERGVWLRLAAPRKPVRRVLALVGVDALIACYPSVDEALAG